MSHCSEYTYMVSPLYEYARVRLSIPMPRIPFHNIRIERAFPQYVFGDAFGSGQALQIACRSARTCGGHPCESSDGCCSDYLTGTYHRNNHIYKVSLQYVYVDGKAGSPAVQTSCRKTRIYEARPRCVFANVS